MSMMRMRFFIVIAAILAMPVVGSAAPAIKQIVGDPLTLNVTADGSFQVFNSTVPGQGQIFPSGSQYGDMGIFAVVDNTLFAPAFTDHTGTATGGLGIYTPWTEGGITEVTGDGSATRPFSVTVRLSAGTLGVSVAETVTYTTGLNYFRITTQWTSNRPRDVRAFLGADIYLASSDTGIFTFEPDLHAPGGTACGVTARPYKILLIPVTTAQAYTSAFYGSVWQQIGGHQLDNTSVPGACIDNGSALQWNNILGSGGTTATVNAAVSFGDVPTLSTTVQNFVLTLDPSSISVFPNTTTTLTLTSGHNNDFNLPIALSAPDLPEGMTMTFNPAVIPAPGDGTSKVTLTVPASVFPTTYYGVAALGTAVPPEGDPEVHGASMTVDVICNPPFILALPASQPQSQSVRRGSTATLSVKNDAGGTATYQWYSGHTGFTSNPIKDATNATFTTAAINETQEFWVRVTNGCGSADSQTATISIAP
jgi:hypothetical protein